MRELEGVNEIHKSNTEYNPHVVEAIRSAQLTKSTKDFIAILAKAKTQRDVLTKTDRDQNTYNQEKLANEKIEYEIEM